MILISTELLVGLISKLVCRLGLERSLEFLWFLAAEQVSIQNQRNHAISNTNGWSDKPENMVMKRIGIDPIDLKIEHGN